MKRVWTNANGQRVRAIDLVPPDRRAWVLGDLGFRRLFEVLEETGPAKAPQQDVAAELAVRSLTRFKRDFRVLTSCTWGAFRREWRLLEAWRMLTGPFVLPKEARIAVGWRSRFHFSEEFNRRFGIDPSDVPRASAPPGGHAHRVRRLSKDGRRTKRGDFLPFRGPDWPKRGQRTG